MFLLTELVVVYSVYRMDYDVALGVSGHVAKETALCETSQPTEPMPYNNADQFAIWCKTLQLPTRLDWKVCASVMLMVKVPVALY